MPDILVDNKNIYHLELRFITVFSWISKIILVLYIIGFFQVKPAQFIKINFVIKVMIALFLIYRFNKYRKQKVQFTELDRKVVYSAGLYILIISFADILNMYTEKIRTIIHPYTNGIVGIMKSHTNQLPNIHLE